MRIGDFVVRSVPKECPARAFRKCDPQECPRESVPREYLDMLTAAYVPLHLHTSAHLYHTCTSTLSLLHIRLQYEMYVLQFFLNFFSVVLAQLRLTLRCRCIDASPSTPPHLSTLTS